MKIDRIAFNEPTVVVLGAGATRGASFVEKLPGALPPLDTDFFTQVQRLSSAKPRRLVTDLIQDTVRIFGRNFRLTMEGYLTHIEYLQNVFEAYRLRGRPRGSLYPQMRTHFLQALAALLDESIGREPICKYHSILVNNLTPSDTILSFNYDWLIDETLRSKASGKWNPRRGYGVTAYSQGPKGAGTKYWASTDWTTGKPSYPPSTITLLKLHGSMNWFPVAAEDEDPKIQLRQRWWHQKGNLSFEIAPPEWNKPLRSGIYRRLWPKARAALKDVRALVFIGYSLPAADLPAQALFMVDAPGQGTAPHLRLLVIVNPDAAARARIRDTLRNRLNPNTRVLTFDTLAGFAKYLDAA